MRGAFAFHDKLMLQQQRGTLGSGMACRPHPEVGQIAA
jgi:hypothetical protein